MLGMSLLGKQMDPVRGCGSIPPASAKLAPGRLKTPH